MVQSLSRRTLLGGMVSGATVGVAGCTGDAAQGDKELRVGLSSNVLETLDPIENPIANRVQLYDTLVEYGRDGGIEPAVAESWTTEDELTWRFDLRDDVVFHDGTPLDADAVAVSLRRAFDESGRLADVPIDSITAVDDHTLRVRTDEPYAPLLSQIGIIWAALLSPDSLEDGEVTDFNSVGPFELDTWEPGQSLTVVPNEDYYGTVPAVDRVVYEVVADHNTRVLNLENDDLDLIKRVPDSQYDHLSDTAGVEPLVADVPSIRFLLFNTDRSPFDDQQVRQALSYAVDKTAIVDSVLEGLTTPARGIVPPMLEEWRNSEVPGYEYDTQQAGDLLDAAGWERDGDHRYHNGEQLSFTLWTYDTHGLPAIAEIVQQQYRQLGIETEIRVTEGNTLQEAKAAGEFDVSMESWAVAPTGDLARLFQWYHSEDSVLNMPYENQRVDTLVEQGNRAVDRDQRQSVYMELQAIAMEELPLAPLTNYARIVGTQSHVSGYDPHPLGTYIDLTPVTVDEA